MTDQVEDIQRRCDKGELTPVTMKLIKLSVCPCGYPALHDYIKIGTEYIVFPESKGISICSWGCGGCKKFKRHVEMVITSKAFDKSYRNWLPAELFFKENA